MNNIIEIKCAKIDLIAKDVIYIKYGMDCDVEIEDVKELDIKIRSYLNGLEVYSITDFSNQFILFTKEAQQFMAKEAGFIKQLLGSSIVINNLPTRLLARFFMSFHKPNYPVKIFATVDDAKDWIVELKLQGQKIAS